MGDFRVRLFVASFAWLVTVRGATQATANASDISFSAKPAGKNIQQSDLIHGNDTLVFSVDDANNHTNAPITRGSVNGSNGSASTVGGLCTEHSIDFDYHKPLFPLDWHHDGLTFILAAAGLLIAASGGIGGGGILVPLFMLVLGFRPKHAIALSNFTILGGAIANTALNAKKKHPHYDRQLIDWDLIVIMEPLTIFGAVLGSLMSKVLPNIVLTVSLVVILAFMGHRTLKKGVQMWTDEARTLKVGGSIEMMATGGDLSGNGLVALASEAGTDSLYNELVSDSEGGRSSTAQLNVGWKIASLTVCFAGTCTLTLLKGGGSFQSPFGFECGSLAYWVLSCGSLPWVLGFAVYFRRMLLAEFEQKVRAGYSFAPNEVQWDHRNTLRYPVLCAFAGLLAGLFGVGGGIVKGPLMLEMGIMPTVASASAAAMILYTSAAASTSFAVFGLLQRAYGLIFFVLGIACTALGQYWVGRWVKHHKRQSPIVLSIGLVISLSSILVAINTVATSSGLPLRELLRTHSLCNSEV